jgi:hypothetical protein
MIKNAGFRYFARIKTIVVVRSTDFALIRQDGLWSRFQSLAQSS